MTIRRLVQALSATLLILAAAAAVLIAVAAMRRAGLVKLEARRFHSYQLADELRHTSDDLTRFARSYVVTGDPRYERYYEQVLAIRSGEAPRPERYEGAYWDLYLDHDRPPRPAGAPQSLLSLMQAAGFTPEEFAALRVSEARSDSLTGVEEAAFRLMKGPNANPTLARRLLNDDAYNRSKAEVMKPIDDFLAMVDARTAGDLADFGRQTRTALITIAGVLLALMLAVSMAYPVLRSRVLVPVSALQRQTGKVAADFDRLAEVAQQIAEGDFRETFSASTAPIRSTRPDEVGDLSRMHDDMLRHLQRTGAAIARITAEMKLANEALNAHLRRSHDLAAMGTYSIDSARRTIHLSSQMASILRVGTEPVVMSLDEYRKRHLHPADGERTTSNAERAYAEGKAIVFESRAIRGDGKVIWVRASSTVEQDEHGRETVVGVIQDITAWREAETERLRAEGQYRELFEGMRDVVFSLTPDGVITILNPAFQASTGLEPVEWIGKPYVELVHPDDRARAEEQLQAALAGQPRDGPPLRLKSSRGWSLAEFRSAPRIEDGRIVGIFGIARDVSERVSLEEQVRQTQKMQALGTLAGGIAHDFNNILTAINGNAELALAEAEDPGVRESLQEIQEAGGRAKDLVRQILIFSRRQAVRREVTDLAPVVEEALKLLRTNLPKTIQVSTRIAPDAPVVEADATQIHQIVMNLGTNAGHAMGERGTLTIDLDAVAIEDGNLPAIDLRPGAYARLSVRDTGVGMSPEILERIFEPFFSTKGDAGTGLGLSVVHGIMRDHDGAITVESEVGKGTAFHLYFPAAEASVSAVKAGPAAIPRGRGQHVMVVDDEEGLAFLMQRVLTRLGYRATTFTNPHEALQAFRTTPAAFEGVITDLSMPGMGGLELIRELRGIRANIPIALASGRPEDREGEAKAGVSLLIQKPATIEEIANGLARLLA